MTQYGAITVCVCGVKLLQSCPLCVTLWTVAGHVPLFVGFPRQEYWSELPLCPTQYWDPCNTNYRRLPPAIFINTFSLRKKLPSIGCASVNFGVIAACKWSYLFSVWKSMIMKAVEWLSTMVQQSVHEIGGNIIYIQINLHSDKWAKMNIRKFYVSFFGWNNLIMYKANYVCYIFLGEHKRLSVPCFVVAQFSGPYSGHCKSYKVIRLCSSNSLLMKDQTQRWSITLPE